MAESLATITAKVQSLLQDTPTLLSTSAGGDLEAAIRDALEHYSSDVPNTLVGDLAGDGSTYDLTLPSTYTDRYSRIVSVEYPADQRPATYLLDFDWDIYRTSSTSKLRLQTITPSTGETVRVTYTALHTLNGLDSAAATTIPTWHTQAFVYLATAKALYRLADRFIHEQEQTLGLDSVDRASKTDLARRMASGLVTQYQQVVGAERGERPAMAVINWASTTGGSGYQRLTHPRRRYP